MEHITVVSVEIYWRLDGCDDQGRHLSILSHVDTVTVVQEILAPSSIYLKKADLWKNEQLVGIGKDFIAAKLQIMKTHTHTHT